MEILKISKRCQIVLLCVWMCVCLWCALCTIRLVGRKNRRMHIGMRSTHVQVHTWVRVHVWSSACFLMCVSQHCSPLSSNCSSMLKPAVFPEIAREADDGSWCYPQILPNTSHNRGRAPYSGLQFVFFWDTHDCILHVICQADWKLKGSSFLQGYALRVELLLNRWRSGNKRY